jgi:predicted AlkP superfamily pyrophosphatase or phosphodiesterase
MVVLVSIDGMRWDYLERHAPPNLQELARDGVRLEQLIPVFPTKTFPNHYTIVTGLRVESHGIVGNEMFDPESGRFFRMSDRAAMLDPKWWGGEPIWNTAGRQGKRTASMFWPGSEVAIGGRQPTYWLPYQNNKPHAERVAQVLAWLALPAAERPMFITLYFSTVDSAGHQFGPLAPQTRDALLEVDGHLGELRRGIAGLGLDDRVTLVVLSDHGMADVSPARVIYLDDALKPGDPAVEFQGPVAGLRLRPGEIEDYRTRLRTLPHVRVLRKTELPPGFGYSNNRRIPDLIVLADEGWEISTRAARANRRRVSLGNHGFDPGYASMGATFIAHGPTLRRGVVLPAMENVHVYHALCGLLGIEPARNDGDDRLLRAIRERW